MIWLICWNFPAIWHIMDVSYTLIGDGRFFWKINRSILEYRSDHLLVLTANGRIRIQGVSLSVLYYTELEMKVTGQITSVLYEI